MDLKTVVSIGVILCSIVSSCYAQSPWVKRVYFQNWGGLNDNLSSTEIADNEASDIQNIVFDTGGALKKRYGYDTVPDIPLKAVSGSITDATVVGLTFFKKSDGNKYLFALNNGDGQAIATYLPYVGGAPVSSYWQNVSGTGLPGSFSDDYHPSFTIANDQVVMAVASGSGAYPWGWAATGNIYRLSFDAQCPKATIVLYHNNHLFLNDISNLSRIWFSKLGDITDYTATDFVEVSTNDGSIVRGLCSAFGSLYIFKDNSIWRLSGYERDSFRLDKMVEGVGTVSHQSIAVVGNVIYFTTAQNDVVAYNGGYEVVFLSRKIRNTIGSMNFTRAKYNLGVGFSTYKYSDSDYYTSMSNAGSSTHNRVLLYDTNHNAWTKFVGIEANAWCVAENDEGQNVLAFGDYDGYVHFYPSEDYKDGNVASNAIAAYYQTKWYKFSDVALGDKKFRLLKTYLLSETSSDTYLTVESKSDFSTGGESFNITLTQPSALWDVAVWDVDDWSGQSLIMHREEIEQGDNMFQLKFENEDVGEGFTIYGWEMFIEPTDRI